MGNRERIELDPTIFTVSSPTGENEYDILSWSDDESEELLDLTSSILVFDRSTTIIIFISIGLFIVLLRLLSSRVTPISGYFASFFSQDFSRLFNNRMRCLFTLLWLMFSFSTMHFITGGFKTDLIQKNPLKRIETLNDLAESGAIPVFSQYEPIFDLFESTNAEEYERVWSKCKENRNLCIPENKMEEAEVNLAKCMKQEAVLITRSTSLMVMKALMCRKQLDKRELNFNRRYTVSKPFIRKIFGFAMNLNVTTKLRNIINKK